MLVLLVCLVSQFVLNELAGSVLPFDHFVLSLGEGLLLSLSDHHVNALGLGLIVLLLLEVADFVLLELVLGGVSPLTSFLFRFLFAAVDTVLLVLFALTVLLGLHLLFHSPILLHLLLLSESVEVSLALLDNLASPLVGFINFADGLSFFTLKKANTVNEKSEILLSLFPSLLGKDKFPVESLIIIVFIGSQVNLLELLVIELLLLVLAHLLVFLAVFHLLLVFHHYLLTFKQRNNLTVD